MRLIVKCSKVPLIALFLLLVAVVGTRSQPQVKSGDVHYLRSTGRTVDVKTPPPLHFRNRQIDLPTSKITATYDDGFHRNPAAKAAFQYAVYLMQAEIASKVEIRVEAVFQPSLLGENTLGSAAPNGAYVNFDHGMPNVWYCSALADKLSGVDENPGQPDIRASFNSSHDFYFGTDGNTPANKHDFVTVVLHELIHGIGFTSGWYDYDTVTLKGSIRHTGFYEIYDFFVVNGSGRSIASFLDPSIALGSQMISDNLFWNGASGKAAYGGNRPKLYAPSQWGERASYSHLDETTYSHGDINALMTPSVNMGESIHDIGPIVRGMLEDMGWTMSSKILAPPIATNQDIATDEDTAKQIILTADSDSLGGLTYEVLTRPRNGTLFGVPPKLTYKPDGNYNGSDSFRFKVNDGWNESNTATVNITVRAVNDAPIAYSQSVTTPRNTAKLIRLSGMDVEQDSLYYTVVSSPVHGTLSTDNGLIYQPDQDYIGLDSFTFKLSDKMLESNVATVDITVKPAPPIVLQTKILQLMRIQLSKSF